MFELNLAIDTVKCFDSGAMIFCLGVVPQVAYLECTFRSQKHFGTTAVDGFLFERILLFLVYYSLMWSLMQLHPIHLITHDEPLFT